MILTRQDIIDISREIVRLWPWSECTQPDTFAVVDHIGQLESSNLGKTYQDYLNGHFWSRDWINSGARTESLCKTYPMLILEQKEVIKTEPFDKEACWEWWFVFADIPDCVNCGNCNRTKDEIDNQLQIIGLNFLKYLEQIKLITFDSSIPLWTTTSQAEKYISDGVYTSYTVNCHDIIPYIDTNQFRMAPGSLGLTDGARSIIFSLTFCSCVSDPTPLGVTSEVPTVASTRCESC